MDMTLPLALLQEISAPLGILLILLGVAAVFLLLLLAVRSMLRDRRHRGTSGALASAVLEVESLLDSSKRHVKEAVQSEQEDDDEDGDPPSR